MNCRNAKGPIPNGLNALAKKPKQEKNIHWTIAKEGDWKFHLTDHRRGGVADRAKGAIGLAPCKRKTCREVKEEENLLRVLRFTSTPKKA